MTELSLPYRVAAVREKRDGLIATDTLLSQEMFHLAAGIGLQTLDVGEAATFAVIALALSDDDLEPAIVAARVTCYANVAAIHTDGLDWARLRNVGLREIWE